jgi:ribosome maturation factor RimP
VASTVLTGLGEVGLPHLFLFFIGFSVLVGFFGGKPMAARDEIVSEIGNLARPILAARGIELVEIVLRGSPGRQLVRLDIDRAGPCGIGLSDCQDVSRELGEALDRTELMPGSYTLEVSSPGIDRPIRSADDFRRNTGRRLVVTTRGEDGAERSYVGTLVGCENDELRLEGDSADTIRIPMKDVVRARQDVTV